MKSRGLRMEAGGWETRSVLECGSPLPLLGWVEILLAGVESARGLAQSKTWRFWLAAFCILASAVCFPAHAQTYSIDWHTIDGGGGTSTGAVYSVSGTLGQPDAGGPLTNGQFSVTGGFWSLLSVVQIPGAPLLTITYAGNQAIVSWPPSVTGWTLQTNNNLATGTWGNYAGPVVNNRLTNAPPIGNLFFRLKNP